MGKIHKLDIGTQFRFYAGADLTDAGVLTVKYKKPDGTTGSWTDGEIWDGTWLDEDGNLDPKYDEEWFRYVTAENDLDEGDDVSKWKFQIYVELASGWKGHGEAVFEVIFDIIS